MINRLCIIGVGLIGGSLALAIKRDLSARFFCKEIIGTGRNAERLQRAVDLNVIDTYDTDMAKAVSQADVILIAAPLGAYASILSTIKESITENTVITDAGSAKACVRNDAINVFGELPPKFVPGHPIAGTEKSGVEAAFAELYQDRRVILTPDNNTDQQAMSLVRSMWHATGAIVEEMSVEHHDEILAATSHLPHMLAFGLVDSLARNQDVDELFRYAAGGFRDFTRIASSDPVMWRDICLHNKDAIIKSLKNYSRDLDEITNAISEDDSELLKSIFSRAKQARDKFCH